MDQESIRPPMAEIPPLKPKGEKMQMAPPNDDPQEIEINEFDFRVMDYFVDPNDPNNSGWAFRLLDEDEDYSPLIFDPNKPIEESLDYALPYIVHADINSPATLPEEGVYADIVLMEIQDKKVVHQMKIPIEVYQHEGNRYLARTPFIGITIGKMYSSFEGVHQDSYGADWYVFNISAESDFSAGTIYPLGDSNLDGILDISDLSSLGLNWFKTVPEVGLESVVIDEDLSVGLPEFSYLSENWLETWDGVIEVEDPNDPNTPTPSIN